MPDAPAQIDDVDIGAVDVAAADADPPFDPRPGNDVVHPVQRAQERALAAAGRTDERGDQVRPELDRDVFERPLVAVEEREAVDVDLDRLVSTVSPLPRTAGTRHVAAS